MNGEWKLKRKPMRRGGKIRPRRFKQTPTVNGDSLRDLRDECDALVRSIVALRDGQCITCRQREGLEVGHLFRRGKSLVRWSLLNVAAQCPTCNSIHNEHPEFYVERFIQKHGEEVYSMLREVANKSHKLTYIQMLAIRDGLRQTLVEMAAEQA